jgi:hypothetical protein
MGAARACGAADNVFYGVNKRRSDSTTGAVRDARQMECLKECQRFVANIMQRDLQPESYSARD